MMSAYPNSGVDPDIAPRLKKGQKQTLFKELATVYGFERVAGSWSALVVANANR
jgi:hypothetical protein